MGVPTRGSISRLRVLDARGKCAKVCELEVVKYGILHRDLISLVFWLKNGISVKIWLFRFKSSITDVKIRIFSWTNRNLESDITKKSCKNRNKIYKAD